MIGTLVCTEELLIATTRVVFQPTKEIHSSGIFLSDELFETYIL